MAKKQPTREEIEKQKEKRKKGNIAALVNLKGNIASLASLFLMKKLGYGAPVLNAADGFIFKPALSGTDYANLETGEKENLLYNAFASSRQDGEIGTGNINENSLYTNAMAILQGSLENARVEDIFSLMGYGFSDKIKSSNGIKEAAVLSYEKIKQRILQLTGQKTLEDSYVGDLPKEMKEQVMGHYQNYLAQTKAAYALGASAKQIPGMLEKILMEDPKKSKKAA